MNLTAFIDLEINGQQKTIVDCGAISSEGNSFHNNNIDEFLAFIKDAEYICGHNIIAHDLTYLSTKSLAVELKNKKIIDTLLFSPLLFPNRPYHRLLKDDKFQTEELNNPLNDAIKARDLLYDELNAFHELKISLKNIYYGFAGI